MESMASSSFLSFPFFSLEVFFLLIKKRELVFPVAVKIEFFFQENALSFLSLHQERKPKKKFTSFFLLPNYWAAPSVLGLIFDYFLCMGLPFSFLLACFSVSFFLFCKRISLMRKFRLLFPYYYCFDPFPFPLPCAVL